VLSRDGIHTHDGMNHMSAAETHRKVAIYIYIKLLCLSVCLSNFRIYQKRADRFSWNLSWFIGVKGRRERKKTCGKFPPLMCKCVKIRKTVQNGVLWESLHGPRILDCAMALRAHLHASLHVLAWGRGP